MQKIFNFEKITIATPRSVLFKICSQPLRDMIVFSFPVPGFTPIRRLKEYFVDQKFLGFSAVNKRFIKDYAMCNEYRLWIFGRITIRPDVELEWTVTLEMKKLSYLGDVENIFWIQLTWESHSWFFDFQKKKIFLRDFIKDFEEKNFFSLKSTEMSLDSKITIRML